MSKVTSQHNLFVVHPLLSQEWHPSKNGTLSPTDVGPMSHKRVWWHCKKGHEWESIISNRSQHGRGCPYCVNQKVYEGNSLATLNPTLSKEWHPTKNEFLTPDHITTGSKKMIWWLCHKGHAWEAIVKSRSNGIGCPFCASKKVCVDNCLANKHPKLAKEWHPSKNGILTPNDATSASGRKIWWICKKGHEYIASVCSRSGRGTGCSFCTNKTSLMELRIYTELSHIFPDTRHREKINKVECDIYIPSLMVGLEYDGVYWHKDKHKKDHAKNLFLEKKGVKLIRVREKGLDTISNYDVTFDFTKKKEKPLIDSLLKGIKEICTLSEPDQLRVDAYLKKSGLANDEAFKNLLDMLPSPFPGTSVADLNTKLAREWHSSKNGKLTPSDVTPMSNSRVWWQCQKGHEWEAKISDRTASKTKCPYCGNKKVCGDNSLAAINPKLANEWHPTRNGVLTAHDVVPFSNKKVWWMCEKGHEWEAASNNRSAGHNCPYCSGLRATKETSLATKKPLLAQEWHPSKNGTLTSGDVTFRSNKKVWWQCQKGHEWVSSIGNRSAGRGCPYCGNKKVCADNCLAIKNPKLAKELHLTINGDLTPENLLAGSHRRVWWQCNKGHEWNAKVVDRFNGTGCPFCSGRRATSETSLAAKKPHLAQEWHPTMNGKLTPGDVKPYSSNKVWWQCKNGHEWEATVLNRAKAGCRMCSRWRLPKVISTSKQLTFLD